MIHRTISCFVALLFAAAALLAEVAPPPQAKPAIEIAICLDTSGSMDGLIESAKQKLWAVVTDLGTAKPEPTLRVALYQYGNDGLSRESGWVEQLCPLTDDLDSVYGKLFPLRTNGGTEYVARAVSAATEQLEWSKDATTLRMIVVAGNEAATQDTQVKLEDACKAAVSKGIVINTIFCGNEQEGRNTGWADAARYADGRYAAIDADGGTVVIASPFDEELAKLGQQLNTTYLPYGAQGQAGQQNQQAQDMNAATLSPSASALRAAGKAQSQYNNAGWDLVDAVAQERVDLAELETDALPEELKALPVEERAKAVEQRSKERKALQEQIGKLEAQRQGYIKEEMAKQGLDDKSAFDTALRSTVREQAETKGIQFDEKP